jgi:hypothetical protein
MDVPVVSLGSFTHNRRRQHDNSNHEAKVGFSVRFNLNCIAYQRSSVWHKETTAEAARKTARNFHAAGVL